jgi:type IV secretory pathway VirB10-like protein
MAKKPEASNPSDEQLALTKGKTPRNAIISIGILAAVVIGVLGFFYELKATNKAEQDARDKKTLALKSSTDVSGDKGQADINQMISAQRDAAASEAAARAASDVAVHSQPVRPMLTGSDFQNEVDKGGIDTQGLARRAAEDAIYTSSIFKTTGATRSNSQPATALPPGVPSLDDARAARSAANANASDGVADQMALQLAKQGQAPEDRDRAFLREAATQGGIEQTTFNGRSRGCTLTPPHTIPVVTARGLNSDKPGSVALMVDEDVYDSLQGDCLMIPKGSFINGQYSSDIKVGQERLLVATTNLRLPNGKSVPLNGMQGADQNGYSGFSGDVNNHFLKIFGASFITAILLKAFDSGSQTGTTASPNGVTTYGSTAGQVAATTAQAVLQRNQNIPPTITVDPGQHFQVQVTQDIVMEPYHE